MSDKIFDQVQNSSTCSTGEDLKLAKPKGLIDKIIIGFTSANIFITSVLLVILITSATFTRYVIQADLYGYDEWAKLLAMWLYFMGAAYGAYNESHVTADIIVAFTPDGIFRRSVIVLKDVISVGICLLFLFYAWDF
ncbi:MAG: TRAP transporter small permease subunit, partial [Bacteroidales bacterium]|nr:TRAP transporter small permease subunit [Bacteroidales bacterium]